MISIILAVSMAMTPGTECKTSVVCDTVEICQDEQSPLPNLVPGVQFSTEIWIPIFAGREMWCESDRYYQPGPWKCAYWGEDWRQWSMLWTGYISGNLETITVRLNTKYCNGEYQGEHTDGWKRGVTFRWNEELQAYAFISQKDNGSWGHAVISYDGERFTWWEWTSWTHLGEPITYKEIIGIIPGDLIRRPARRTDSISEHSPYQICIWCGEDDFAVFYFRKRDIGLIYHKIKTDGRDPVCFDFTLPFNESLGRVATWCE